jgi:2-polyprenyl-3-methyl-5-hydroxy-6-metoxy-1,4-benzoquinol methylase
MKAKDNCFVGLKRALLRKLRAPKESKSSSYRQHNSEYEVDDALERHREVYASYEAQGQFNSPENRYADLLTAHPHVRDVAVDIGAGAGWLSARLSKEFNRVIAIEPSEAAIQLALRLFPPEEYCNVEWRRGFAEDILRTMELNTPAVFITGCVLSHLPDKAVDQVCVAINRLAPEGSILAFAECWGGESHEFMWHVRTKDWWQARLSSFNLDFFGPEIQNVRGRHKGFHGVKVS